MHLAEADHLVVDDRGDPVNVSQDVTGVVVGVTFENGYPEVILGSGARAPISDLISVSQTSGQAAAAASPGRQPGSATTPNHSTSSGLPLSEQLETATTHGIDAAMELIEGEGQ